MSLAESLKNTNVQAFLRVIRAGESSQDDSAYTVINGGSHFTDFSKHPWDGITTTLGAKACGAYQFLGTTWAHVREKYDLPDFSPNSQDLGAVALIEGRGALDDVVSGDIRTAIHKLSTEWVSLASMPLEKARKIFADYGGSATVAVPELVSEPVQPTTTQNTEATMPEGEQQDSTVSSVIQAAIPFISIVNPLAGALAAVLPKIGGILLDKTNSVPQRNIALAGAVLDTVAQATGSNTHAEGIQKVIDDPVMRAKAEAALSPFFVSTEAGSDGYKGARDFAVKAIDGKFWYMPAFWITILLLPLLYGTVYFVLTGPIGFGFPSELKAAIASSVVTGILGGILGFWLGSSVSSQRKDQTIQSQANR